MVTLLTRFCDLELQLMIEAAKVKFNLPTQDLELDIEALDLGFSLAISGFSSKNGWLGEVIDNIKALDMSVYRSFQQGFRFGSDYLENEC
ncbi:MULTISPECIES: hypothetical protein [unclassified Vibrio]|uniref:hypothetical protein n=1 Tax=unclassified Vibrio TaxID=2614977 RepID=UPI000B8EA3FA|nr:MULTISPECIES: hypothetical protein [unclassified Vibrio]NAW91718.1 hypothetical protein [Vibrio sp. V24_P1S3T111]OXX19166.1 hypothetical protein B9J86_16300 [Vibrio sp. V06_P1A73T115]OXX24944.1 hypothetical protein B9J88_04735 [Vibrio sp. V05_P4A8T149]OXX36321.1 hypothetical protein B9J81_06515 [Vibrio sp. V04_P4A5T148]OXX55079.1 hypothetical protein B9J91_10010 [Vibrio sp. V18_P1S4T112]